MRQSRFEKCALMIVFVLGFASLTFSGLARASVNPAHGDAPFFRSLSVEIQNVQNGLVTDPRRAIEGLIQVKNPSSFDVESVYLIIEGGTVGVQRVPLQTAAPFMFSLNLPEGEYKLTAMVKLNGFYNVRSVGYSYSKVVRVRALLG